MGGWVIRFVGQVRSAKSRSNGLKGMYLVAGFLSIFISDLVLLHHEQVESG